MIKRISFYLITGVYWLFYFLFVKAFFLLFNYQLSAQCTFVELFKVFRFGMSMDLSAMAYLLVIPSVVILFSILYNSTIYNKVLKIYTIMFLILITLLVVGDAELYHFWGFRLDITPLLYLKTPHEAFASVSAMIIIRQMIYATIIFSIFYILYRKIQLYFKKLENVNPFWAILFLPLILILILPIRGGIGIASMNTSRAYFSNNNFLNHSAINLFWNIGFSISEKKSDFKQYDYFDKKELSNIVNPLLNSNILPDSIVLNTPKPNIILIILESFSAKVIGTLGGKPNITPNINALSKEGLLFTNFFASGDRSDKGLIAILCGYPAQPITSIIVYSHKTESLPKFSQDLQSFGYNTSFYYGGDLNFANMKSYLVESKFNNIISMTDFPKSTYNSKWGTHDHIVFNKLYKDINASKEPFFKAYFTLSSHEPFEVPRIVIPGTDNASKLMNAIHYTDSCVGNFIDKAKTQPWWNNTLVILVADHGHPDPGHSPNHVPAKFRIPMLWLGGALKVHGTIKKYASQTDIPSTLLHQLGKSSDRYIFSKDIFSKTPGFAYYSFNNGFGFMTDSSKIVFDSGFSKLLIGSGLNANGSLIKGKAFLQNLYIDFNSRN